MTGYLEGVYEERKRIWGEINQLYHDSEQTRTPIYQDTMYKKLNSIIWGEPHPPTRFRDTSNGE